MNKTGHAAATQEHPMTDVVRSAIVASPLAALLGIELVEVADDLVRARLPFRTEVTTIGDLVHGGAIAALVDVAATAAAWTRADLSRSPRGTTIGFSLNYLNGAVATDLVATATVIQRGKSVQVIEVDVRGTGEKAIARATVTYKLDHKAEVRPAA
ncbi:MAG TPA: PaaI family thioesterase [Candidatus Binatia bacterium]|jgi:uncharacterized protein (TIGR00369 family)